MAVFGLVVGLEKEFGYFLLSELESVKGPLGLKIERDRYWKPITLGEFLEREKKIRKFLKEVLTIKKERI